ncbi:site-specific integrase [Thermoanaerobacterium thermosaccharolyticum]|uniref:site-specific integrase n=1 Tax=Thermoanaerobacterium thermosaccharolyticum TaxID=1517 RepID=UPI00123A2FA6|nr:tyrosine-type recombinase/integrase [Thermoanaerobacterium thermosaccharolyticum]KAA5805952.1 site-specific integrase [Thermoanaerobacterium thermosaccharolyticum]
MARQKGQRGQIIDKGNGTYLVRVCIGVNDRGIPQYHNKTIHGKKGDAQKYLTEKLRELDTGKFIKEDKILLKDYLDKWIEIKKPSIALKTYDSYKKVMEIYIKPYIGDYIISKLTPMIIQDMYNKMTEKGLKSRIVIYTHTVLKQALDQAIKWQMLNRNPCDGLTLPKRTQEEMKVLTPEQAKKFLEACVYNRFGVLFELLLTSGMRPSEALGLKWDDIDWKGNRIIIQRTLSRVGKTWELKEPKTKHGRRTIPLPPEIMKDLKEHRKNQLEEKLMAKETLNYDEDKNKFEPEEWEEKLNNPEVYIDYGLVFATETGKPIDLANINHRYFKPLLKETGLPDIRLYDLRHTCATLLLMAGENPKVVSERLGHANVAITLDIYSHVLPDMQESATKKLKDILF